MTSIERFRKPLLVAGTAAAISFALGGMQPIDLFGLDVPQPLLHGLIVGTASTLTNGVVRPLLLEKFAGSDIAGISTVLGEPALNTAVIYGMGMLVGEPDVMTSVILGAGSTIAAGYLESAFMDY